MLRLPESLRPLVSLFGGFLLLLLTVGTSVVFSIKQHQTDYWVHHALDVEGQINELQTLVTDAETGQRGYLLTGRQSYLDPYQAARRRLPPGIDRLAAATADNPAQQAALANVRALTANKLAEMQHTIDLRAAGRGDEALALVDNDHGMLVMADIRQALAGMRAEERRVLAERSALSDWLAGTGQIVLGVAVTLILALSALALIDGRRRLLALQAANERLATEMIERQAAESQLRQLQKIEAIGQLTGGIAHDFNNMLAIIVGSLDIARNRLTGVEHPAVSKCIDAAMEGANRATVLTARLLAFSRRQPLEPRVLDANKLVAGMSELLRRTIGAQIQIETVLAGGLWRVHADPGQLESALVNLAVNARDAMPDGGMLTIETANAELDDRYAAAHNEVTAGQYVMMSVTDTGCGMPPEVVERAFDPFYTTKRVGKGTGLGLSQVFGFVKQSGGHVKIYSEVGRGTTVKVYLPRHFGAAPAPADMERTSAPLPAATGETVLVVEDEADVRALTAAALRELGYTVVEAGSAAEALQQIERHERIDLLFTDIVMPEMSGRTVAEHALVRRPKLKVLYTTGYTRNAVVHNGIVDPGTAFLSKPFTLKQLAVKVRQTLDG